MRAREIAHRTGRALLKSLAGIAILATFVASCLFGLALHLDTAAAKRIVQRLATDLVSANIRGQLTIHAIDTLSWGEIEGVVATATHPSGRRVIEAQRVDGRFDPLVLLSNLFQRSMITIEHAELSGGRVDLSGDGWESLAIAETFESPGPSAPSGSRIGVVLEDVVLNDVLVTGGEQTLPFSAQVSGVEGSLHVAEDVTIVVNRAHILSDGAPRDAEIDGMAAVEITVADDGVALAVLFDGAVGPAPVTLSGRYDDAIDGRLVVGPVGGAALQRFVPALALHDDIQLTLHASGPPGDISLALDVTAGDAGDVSFDGIGSLEPSTPSPELTGDVTLRSVDLARILPDGPPTALAGRGRLRLDVDGPTTIDASLRTERGDVAGRTVPPLNLTARYADGEARFELEANEPEAGLTIDATADFHEPITIAGSVAIDHLDLGALPLPNMDATGVLSGTLETTIRLAEAGPRLDARASLTLHDPRLGDLRADALHLSATAQGPITAALTILAHARARGLVAAGQRFETATAQARGPASSLHVDLALRGGSDGVASVDAESVVRVARDSVVLDSPVVELTRHRQHLTARAHQVTVTPRLDVDDLTVEAPGLNARADLSQTTAGGWSIDLEGDDLDVGRVASLLGIDAPLAGRASIDADLLVSPGAISGTLTARWRDVTAFGHRGIAGQADVTARGRSLSLDLEGRGGPVDDLVLDADLDDVGAALDPRSYAGATGRARLRAEVDLGEARRMLAPIVEIPPLPRIDGHATLVLRADRDRAHAAPNIDAELALTDATIRPRGQFARALDGAFWPAEMTVMGVSVGLEASVDSATELVDLELRVQDEQGELAALDGDLEIPWTPTWRAIIHGRRPQLPPRWWRSAEVRLWGRIPRRRLQSLPGFDMMGIASGDLRLVVSASGTIDDPKADVVLRSFGIGTSSIPVDHPIDLVAVGQLDREGADARVKIFAPDRQMAVGHFRFRGSPTTAVLDGADDWRLDAHGQLCDLPLMTLAPLQEFLLRGRANGAIEVVGINSERPSIDVDLRVDDFQVGDAHYREVVVKGESAPAQTTLDARIARDDGRLRLHADLPLEWGGVLPTPIHGRGATVKVVADRFDVQALKPFLEGSVNELSGRLDGTLEGELSAHPSFEGKLAWSNGRLQLATLNTRLKNIEAQVQSRRDGRLVLESLRAESMDGALEASGHAFIDGLTLREAHVRMTIPKNRPVPIVIEGKSYGRASLEAEADLRPYRKGYRTDVKVRKVHIELPRSLGSRAVALEPADFIHFGTRHDETFVPLRLSPPSEEDAASRVPWLVDLELEDVEIERQDLSVYLTGHPQIELSDDVRMRGQIQIRGGRLDVQGRTFEIEEGTIDFDNRPPDDPIVNVTASWRGPEGTIIYAKYIGPVSTGEVQLTSDPARPKSELLALLLFGDANHQVGGGEGSDAAGQAVGLGGSVLAKGLNEALDDLIALDLATRIDTTSSSNPEAELQWRVARQFSLAISHVLGIPEPGESPDRNYAGIEWRFAHEWSLETTVGDHGSTSVDVLWQHSY